MKKLAITLTAVIGVVVIGCTITIAIVVSNLTAAQKEADYRACLYEKGIYQTTDLEDMVDIATPCHDAVYG